MQTAELDELRARTPLPPLIGRRVKLARSGRNLTGCCPFHRERTPSFYVYADHFHCFGCGAHGDAIDFLMQTDGFGFHDAVKALRIEAGLGSSLPAAPPPRTVQTDPPPGEHLDLAGALFKESVPPAGTMVEVYLRFRGCALPRGGVLRFHPACPRGRDERLPAMLAAMTDPVSNRFAGVHRTFLRPDGRGKIEHGKAKMMLGGAGVIRLAPDDEITLGLGICEGIETGLALMQHAGWASIWAAGNAVAMGKFPVLAGIESLTLFPDLDDTGAGRLAAEACTSRWIEAGRAVQTIWPPNGADWNDCLVRKAA